MFRVSDSDLHNRQDRAAWRRASVGVLLEGMGIAIMCLLRDQPAGDRKTTLADDLAENQFDSIFV
jgi:hypothetical protein